PRSRPRGPRGAEPGPRLDDGARGGHGLHDRAWRVHPGLGRRADRGRRRRRIPRRPPAHGRRPHPLRGRSMTTGMLAPGMRRTAQRQMVYDTIVRLGGHCTADEITAELHRARPGFPRSTVYRALDALTASGSVYAAHL